MIRIYYLPVEPTDEGEAVLGIDLIHHAILECTEEPDIRKLTMDTTDDEHAQLQDMAVEVREPTQDELDAYNALDPVPEPIVFHPENPVLGVEQRLAHVEQFLHDRYPS